MLLTQLALISKILLTLFWFFPLLFLSKNRLEKLGVPEINLLVFVRLLGAAFFALLVGYVLGLYDLTQGRFPKNTVVVGIVSNGLACLILIYFIAAGRLNEWQGIARIAMKASMVLTGLITVSLIAGLIKDYN